VRSTPLEDSRRLNSTFNQQHLEAAAAAAAAATTLSHDVPAAILLCSYDCRTPYATAQLRVPATLPCCALQTAGRQPQTHQRIY
jgi:hypothetical protein